MNKRALSDWCESIRGCTLFQMNTVIHADLYKEGEVDEGNNEIWGHVSTQQSHERPL